MKNKKGFTLVELLAVIALIGLVLMLVVPNILGLFNRAKKNIFQDELMNIYNSTHQTYVYRSSNGDYSKRYCVGKDATLNKLELEDKENLYYDITVNSYGEILSFKVSNDVYGINLTNANGIKKKDINNDRITDPFDINCNGSAIIPDPDDKIICTITETKRYCDLFDFSYTIPNDTL